jgi:hypothetical protein
MPDFASRVSERSEQSYHQMHFWAEIDNACFDRARELEADLAKYLRQSSSDVQLARNLNVLTLTKPDGHILTVMTQDHRTHEVARPGQDDIRDQMRKAYPSRFDDRRMMDEVLEWLAKPIV